MASDDSGLCLAIPVLVALVLQLMLRLGLVLWRQRRAR